MISSWKNGLALAAALIALGAKDQDRTASTIIQNALDRAMAVLRDPALRDDRESRHRRLREIASEVFDWSEMARRSLGAPWRTINAEQRRRFVDAFQDLLATEYMNDIDRIQGTEKIEVTGEKQLGEDRAVDTVVHTHSGEKVPITYFLQLENGAWRAYDVSVEGLSLANHYRETFRRMLSKMSFSALLEQLERKHEALDGSARSKLRRQ